MVEGERKRLCQEQGEWGQVRAQQERWIKGRWRDITYRERRQVQWTRRRKTQRRREQIGPHAAKRGLGGGNGNGQVQGHRKK